MSIIIKGMEMPKSCSECKFRIALGCCGNLPHNTRVPTCPLVEIPPHGRLIDADALPYENMRKMVTSDEWGLELQYIDDAPTIIEAEDEDG